MLWEMISPLLVMCTTHHIPVSRGLDGSTPSLDHDIMVWMVCHQGDDSTHPGDNMPTWPHRPVVHDIRVL